MKNTDVVTAFLNGESKAKTKNLRIEGKNLINYNTILAQRVGDGKGNNSYVVNITKYSQSTTTIQNVILKEIPESKILRCVTGIPMGADYLI